MTNPQLEEPKELENQGNSEGNPQPEAQAQALLAELEKAGFTTPEQVAGALEASKQVGTMAQHLGSSRSENENLRQELALLRRSIESGQRNFGDSSSNEGEGSIDLRGLIRNELRDFYKSEVIEPQTKAQQQFHAEMEEVTTDEDYPLVAEAFQRHLYSPQIQSKLIRNETTVTKEYNRTIRAAMRAMLGKAAGSLKELTKKPDAPHMESGSETTPTQPTGTNEKISTIHEARSKGLIGSDDALQKIVNASLFGNPDGPKK
jgi:regulator of replication initiation timing